MHESAPRLPPLAAYPGLLADSCGPGVLIYGPMDDKPYPPCFGSWANYERWLDSFSAKGELGAAHCTDCLPSFKVRMVACRRCEHPETVFQFEYEAGFTEDDGGLVIRGAWKPLAKHRGPRAITIKKAPIAVPNAQPVETFWQRQERLHRERLAMRS